jgi:ABC-type dipeptide/oligopeptide/nickel transport system permease subunit
MISKDKFVIQPQNFSEAEHMATVSVSFWKDAIRRLRKNIPAMIGFWFIVFIIIMAIIGPREPLVPNNEDGTPYRFDAAPVIHDLEGNEITKDKIAYVPARIPYVEKLGIFNGITQVEVSTFDLLIGALPKDNEFRSLKLPANREKLIEKLEIPYHPFEINISNVYEEGENLLADITILETGEELTVNYADLVSEYSRYQPGKFEWVSSGQDDYGIEMIKVKANFYEIQGIPNQYFWFGTDKLALDIWTRVWVGVGVSLLIALSSLIFDFSIGIVYGTVAGFFGGTMVDTLMMRFTEIVGSIPMLVLMVIFISIRKSIERVINGILPVKLDNYAMSFLILVLAMSLTGWIGVSQVVRSQILKLREQEFILASRTLGASKGRLMAKHLFPNIIGQIVVMATFSVPSAIFYEAFLTFIGIGLPIPMASLGVLVRDGYNAIKTIPSMLLIPATIMCLLMLSINLLANGLRDALDPRMR